jgi:predicted NBD/HSP70 family sugar kinase
MAAEPVLVALDFTGGELRLLFTDLDGVPVERGAWPLPELETEHAWSWEVGGRIATLFAAEGAQRSALAIAVAAPGVVDPLTGRLEHSTGQEAWDGLAVVEALRRHIDAPIACESRTAAALLGERWQGAAQGVDDILYVSLRGVPAAAMIAGGRPVRGARFAAGALPAMPELAGGELISDADLETASGLLADAAALLAPELVVIDGEDEHTVRLIPLLQRVLDEVAPGPRVVASALGDNAALVGAAKIASSLAYEGERKP